jgi:hypothetical protein
MEKVIRYEPRGPLVAMGREMKALLVLVLLVLAVASALAYGEVDVARGLPMAVRDWRVSEPGVMLISGSVLLGLGGMLRRMFG